jgi:hypothetical protein
MDDKLKKQLIDLARQAIKSEFTSEDVEIPDIKEFREKRGCFVTLYKDRKLRGCIGMPYPSLLLGQAVMESAKSAAFSDPRFPQLDESEFQEIMLEISILTSPKEIKCKNEEFCKNIKIGEDGLMCQYKGYSGLLLPQVAEEYRWSEQEFLNHLCQKAGLPSESWKKQGFKLWKFQAEIIKED